MSLTRPAVFWITLLLAAVAVVVLLREVLLPFVAGIALAYLFNPLATRLERVGMNRLVVTLVIVSLFITGSIVLVVLTAPVIVSEVAYFIDQLPRYLKLLQGLATDTSRPWLSKVVGEGLTRAEDSIGEFTSLATGWAGTFLHSLWSGGQALVSAFSLLIVTPIVACYLIYDWKKMVTAVDNWVPPARRDTVRALAREIDVTIGGFVRGQGTLCLLLAVFYGAALSLTGLVVSTCVALAQFWPNWTLILMVPAIFFVGQSIADYVLAPYLVGRRVNLSPVWVMFALFACGYLFGFVGLLIAVPLAAAIGVILRFALTHYYASPLYGAADAPAKDEGVQVGLD
jgi:predicted PurR-regulated permease PerM